MRTGEVIDERFVIEHRAGSGGMGDVYRARDLVTGEAIALKLLQRAGAKELGRVSHEAQALAMLQLPGVVRYAGHGVTGAGQPYLAMEWIEGETLEVRLARRALSVDESVELATSVAQTLGAIHRLGLVHRDLKPSNLLLSDGTPTWVTLIDFGIVWDTLPAENTLSDTTIGGTPGYMAPEQVEGEAYVDARADVFALGCVLFECLTGRAAFVGDSPLALLAKVLLEDPPTVRELRADVPAWLDRLVARMLAKSLEVRPRDGDTVAAALAAADEGQTGPSSALRASSRPRAAPELTAHERRMMTLILAEEHAPERAATLAESDDAERTRALRELVALHGGRLDLVQEQWMLVALSGAGAPTDLAVRAARCAHALQARLGGVPMAVVTGRAEVAGKLPVGEIIARATELLPRGQRPGPASIRVDEVTAALLGSRFEITQDGAAAWLGLPLQDVDEAPRLLGRPAACVGRDRELRRLLADLRHCTDERASGAVIVTAPAGLGKSRLRQEFLSAVRASGETIEVWLAQGDPLGAGSAFGLLSQALRRALGILEGEPLEARRSKVSARVGRHPGLGREAPRIAAFLGELVGAPFPDAGDGKLRAARRSPVVMGDQLRAAWQDFLRAECAAHPVVLVLEDLHWGDLPTVNLVEAGLSYAADLPFFVLALGRPDLDELFPGLWRERSAQLVRLGPLSPRACEALVRGALGEGARPELCAELVARAEGSPFFLEELLRAAVDGRTERLPETVIAIVQARFDALDAEARRVLRAASVFGDTFWRGGVEALVGGAEVGPQLRELCERELIVAQREGRIAGEVEYRFRHGLMREAAYGLLTERDRRLGHALAGDWLECAGETDAMALAGHFMIGGEPARAATAFLRAAEDALRGNDLDAAIERADRGVACGPEAHVVGALRRAQAEAHLWRGDFALAEERGVLALERLERGSPAWFSAAVQVLNATYKRSAVDRLERWVHEVLDAPPVPGALDARNMSLGDGATALIFNGRYDLAEALIERLERSTLDPAHRDPEVVARLWQARALRLHLGGDLEGCIAAFEAALAAFDDAGDRRNACSTRLNLGFLRAELGEFAAAEALMSDGIAAAKRMALHEVDAYAQQNLGIVLAYRGRLDEGRAREQAALSIAQRVGNLRLDACARIYLARIELLAGESEAAEREARAAAEILESASPLRPLALAVRASALMALGRLADALAGAGEAFGALEALGALEEGEALVRLVYAEALAANGDRDGAGKVAAVAREKLLERAAKLRDPERRERFLREVPENARTLERARAVVARGDDDDGDAG